MALTEYLVRLIRYFFSLRRHRAFPLDTHSGIEYSSGIQDSASSSEQCRPALILLRRRPSLRPLSRPARPILKVPEPNNAVLDYNGSPASVTFSDRIFECRQALAGTNHRL